MGESARAGATVLGYAIRVLGKLPRPARRAVLGRATAGELPPVPDYVRMMEIAGDMPDTGPTDGELFARFPELAAVEVSEPAAGVPARLYRPAGESGASTLVWVHGGAFVGGNLRMAESHWVGLALAARGIPVLALDYRKALHGVRFPAASDDVLTGWTWAVENLPADHLHLGGASAGGNLAAGVAKRLRDGAGPLPASLVLAYPVFHAELPEWNPTALAAIRDNPGVVYFSPDWVRDMSRHYAGDAKILEDPYAFPANGDAAGTPPTIMLNCEADTLRSSAQVWAEQLRAAGVTVAEHQEPGAGHGCLGEPFSVAGQAMLDRITSHLRRW
ncbi:alpha/beta hydrolase fold domain-containing protein [Actinoplanes sp. NBRC 101535]|uniref:alpha/beta hydrolase n=1 Tax=Actinoplanes sp. NBRC 101535 TaxID=3032196 RepID=UPI0024A3C608|nr:alpha/beta hydrolase fold domain-containing protein [Actinoplanes sp. NBRC 101535]GLY02470.1 hypothetical protein Acsp01_28490 [Actinoplanes sp. NBRC 101535]